VYTTLDQNLQRDAAEAVRIGMEEVDKRIKIRKKKDPKYPDPQCALIALDALNGGTLLTTRATMLQHEPTTFLFDGKPYEPSNFEKRFYVPGPVRDAMA